MSNLGTSERKWLETKFGARANFSPAERVLYGHDALTCEFSGFEDLALA